MNLSKMIRALVIAVLASALVYLVMVLVSDGPEVARALAGFDGLVLVAMLLLSVGCYVLRSYRWGRLMNLMEHPVRFADALYLHMSGQTMGISPGRVGEVLKPWLSREIAGLPMSRGLALVFAERVADLIAVCILALGGLSALGGGMWTLAVALGAIVAGTAVASSSWFHRLVLGAIGRQEWAHKHHASATAISETVRVALSWRALWWSVTLSVVAWGFEGIGFALCLRALGFGGLDVFAAVSVYAVATIVGAFTFLPGGIGLTEASMAGILVTAGMAVSAASAATLVTRVVTLWWAVLLGWLMLASRPVLFRRLLGRDGGGAVEGDAEAEG
jgi:uncharacterized membrane protein YbhN (UPF0104 family)